MAKFMSLGNAQAKGHGLEWHVSNCLNLKARALGIEPEKFFSKAKSFQDEKEGTDFFVKGKRIDFTYRPLAKKDHCTKALLHRSLGEYKGVELGFDFGVRFGNCKRDFATPVYVFAFTGVAQDPANLCPPAASRFVKRLERYLDEVEPLYKAARKKERGY